MLEFLNQPSEIVAPQLLGWQLVRELNGRELRGTIVETEAYSQFDAASHSYRGKTPRTEIMFGPAGFAYVYFTYGMHYCFNVVTGKEGEGSAVLIRALEPIDGLDMMQDHRNGRPENELTNGPAKLCQALSIDKQLNAHDLRQAPLRLEPPRHKALSSDIEIGTRIGISQDTYRLWRFWLKDSPFVSR